MSSRVRGRDPSICLDQASLSGRTGRINVWPATCGTYRLHSSTCLFHYSCLEIQAVAVQGGRSSLQDDERHSAPQIRDRRHGRDLRVREGLRPSVKEESASENRTIRRKGGRFPTKSPTLQISTAFLHLMLRITSGARYGIGMAFPLCSLPMRACPKSQIVSGPAPPSIYRET